MNKSNLSLRVSIIIQQTVPSVNYYMKDTILNIAIEKHFCKMDTGSLKTQYKNGC